MCRLLACLAIVWFACPAAACINDLELPAHEREFRSGYRGPASPPSPPSAEPTDHRLLLGAGAAMLAGAAALALTGGRRRS